MAMDDVQSQFIADAQELVERLYRDVEYLRTVHSQGRQRRELAARIFRRVHTLKGSSGSLGFKSVTQVAHEFEGVLDGVRLGRIPIDDALLDVFEDATDSIAQALAKPKAPANASTTAVIAHLQAIAVNNAVQGIASGDLRSSLPNDIARSLSEYDIQHAREAVREGARLFIVSARLELETFDQKFRELTSTLGQAGEVIATTPGEPVTADEINLRLLYAAELVPQETLRRAGALGRIDVEQIKIEATDSARTLPETSSTQPPSAGARRFVNIDLGHLDGLISDASELFRDTTNTFGAFRSPPNQGIVEVTLSSLRRRFVELEERLIKLRLVPLAEILQRAAARAGRIAARQLGKDVEFEIAGGDVGIDKTLADSIAEPLLHLVRNAISHGIETPQERIAAGKSPIGRIRLVAYSEGCRINISVTDDGRGIDLDRIATAANAHGIVDQGPRFTMDQGLRLIFRPGFTTSTEVSELSGRGIGLEVVDRAMEQSGGEVRVATERGVGTTFAMILPAALALVQCVIVRSGSQYYCIEAGSIAHFGSLDEARAAQIESNGSIDWHGEKLPLMRLSTLLAQSPEPDEEETRAMIVWRSAGHLVAPAVGQDRFALAVDSVTGQQETLVRSLGRHAARWHGVSGAAELLDGNVALVLDVGELVKSAAQ